MVSLSPTKEDYQSLLNGNPQATAELKAIILARLLIEKDAELEALRKEQADSKEVDDAA